jgi:hypothetical protein
MKRTTASKSAHKARQPTGCGYLGYRGRHSCHLRRLRHAGIQRKAGHQRAANKDRGLCGHCHVANRRSATSRIFICCRAGVTGRKEATRDDAVSVGGYNLFNLGARYSPGGEQGRVSFRIYADNILDKRYWKDTGASYGDTFHPPRSAHNGPALGAISILKKRLNKNQL